MDPETKPGEETGSAGPYGAPGVIRDEDILGIEERVARLERGLRRWRWATGLLLVLALALAQITVSAVRSRYWNRIEAREFVLVDEAGHQVATLNDLTGGPSLWFFEKGGRHLSIGSDGQKGLGLVVGDDKGMRAAIMDGKGGPMMVLHGPDGVEHFAVHINSEHSRVELIDREGVAALFATQWHPDAGIDDTHVADREAYAQWRGVRSPMEYGTPDAGPGLP